MSSYLKVEIPKKVLLVSNKESLNIKNILKGFNQEFDFLSPNAFSKRNSLDNYSLVLIIIFDTSAFVIFAQGANIQIDFQETIQFSNQYLTYFLNQSFEFTSLNSLNFQSLKVLIQATFRIIVRASALFIF